MLILLHPSDPSEVSLIPTDPPFADPFDRRDKPSVLVTSPGSPDHQQQHQQQHCSTRGTVTRYSNRLAPGTTGAAPPFDPNVGGRIQLKLGFESTSLQLIVTIVCAAGLTQRSNGAPRNPYAKVSARVGHGNRELLRATVNRSIFNSFLSLSPSADIFTARIGQVKATNKDFGEHKWSAMGSNVCVFGSEAGWSEQSFFRSDGLGLRAIRCQRFFRRSHIRPGHSSAGRWTGMVYPAAAPRIDAARSKCLSMIRGWDVFLQCLLQIRDGRT